MRHPAFYRFRDRPGEKVTGGDGQPIRGPHGYYDGLYWMQEYALGGTAEQLGYVEGYLLCWENCMHNKGGIFSRTPSEYVSLITNWYQFDPKTGDVNPKRQPVPIADVLHKFRDVGAR